ncbi:hypothetical protein [Paraferrimonas sedimenticola]|uniref:Uncharacterized protein n=1 Tax=Paraferrimonas sedimenticola TaxID=375674 RepID=A0AA37RTY8_9GAMM|nr:hypothetical protein [Paraferrimonas sedimenticola]GLP95284.1 hypothetical protein GCM10007895_05900 [Paraferrimonas sedimenticola]
MFPNYPQWSDITEAGPYPMFPFPEPPNLPHAIQDKAIGPQALGDDSGLNNQRYWAVAQNANGDVVLFAAKQS